MSGILKITSRDNEHLKRARRVRDGRDEQKIFLEGVRLVDEAARSRTPVENVFASGEFLEEMEGSELNDWLRPRRIFEVSESLLQSLSDTNNAQGIVVIAERPANDPERILERKASATAHLVVLLHQINNPANLGAVVRTAEAAGAAGVIVSDGSADAFSTKALRAAMGSSLRLPIWTGVRFDRAIEWASHNGFRTIAADIKAKTSYTDVDWQIPRMLVIGSEAHGLADEDLEKIDELTLVPMEKEVESLNIAVAAGVIMFEARRQNKVR